MKPIGTLQIDENLTLEHFMWLHPSFFWIGDLQLEHGLELVTSQRQFAEFSVSSSVPVTTVPNNNALFCCQLSNALPALVFLCGIDFLLQSAPRSFLVVLPHLSLTLNPVFSLRASCTGRSPERLRCWEKRYIISQIQYNTILPQK